MSSIPSRHEFSAGGVVYRKAKEGYEFLLGKHSGYHKWVIPKGLVETGEKPEETAVREVREETGVVGRLVAAEPVKTVEYIYMADPGKLHARAADGKQAERRVKRYQESGGSKIRVFKKVAFYLLEYTGGDPKDHDWEMEDAGWYPYAEAKSILGFDGEREVLEEAGKRLGVV